MVKSDLVKVVVNIFGDEYIVRGAEDPDYIEMLAAYVDRKMRSIQGKSPGLADTKIAVLAALNLADELSKLQEDYDQLVKTMEEVKGNRLL
ncbi:MAG: cell division protein ZapA [Acidobacteriota bacterium]